MRKKMWHCKSCGRVCDSSNSVCPDCGLDLVFYGEIQFVETGEPEPSSPSGSQTQEQAALTAEEQSRPEIKEEHKAEESKLKTKKEHKSSKPKKGGKRGTVLILTGLVLLVLVGCIMFVNMRRLEDVEVLWSDGDMWMSRGSNAQQVIYVYYKETGFWGPWPVKATSGDRSVVKVSSVEKYYDDGTVCEIIISMEARKAGTAEITVKVGDARLHYQVEVY